MRGKILLSSKRNLGNTHVHNTLLDIGTRPISKIASFGNIMNLYTDKNVSTPCSSFIKILQKRTIAKKYFLRVKCNKINNNNDIKCIIIIFLFI